MKPDVQPAPEEISALIRSPLYDELCVWLEETYGVTPLVEYSKCSMAMGWNVKYRRGSRALCTLYPGEGAFTCMVVVGRKEADAAEKALLNCEAYTRALYETAGGVGGARWLMMEITTPERLRDAKTLISLRARPSKR